MPMGRYLLKPIGDCLWTVNDNETGFSITFREGMFNETQEVKNPDTFPDDVDLATWAARAMSGIGDYMAQEHPFIATCNICARRSALWILSHESWWVTLAAACNSLMIDEEEGDLTTQLLMELDDYFNLSHENPANLGDREKNTLMGAVSLLNKDEAAEVFHIIHTFWHEYYENGCDTEKWARDLLWWTIWANQIISEE